MRLAVIFPSRGLAFSETVEEVIREVTSVNVPARIFFSHSRQIPDCFNIPAGLALNHQFTHFWFVEDDMVLPEGILQEMIDMDVPAVTADYPVTDDAYSICYDDQGNVMWSGTGCLLMDRETLLRVYPFSTDWMYTWAKHGWEKKPVTETHRPHAYGLHDVHLGMTLYKENTPLMVCPTMANQRHVTRFGEEKQNANGWHDIDVFNMPDKERP
jgi:hypothetical protein